MCFFKKQGSENPTLSFYEVLLMRNQALPYTKLYLLCPCCEKKKIIIQKVSCQLFFSEGVPIASNTTPLTPKVPQRSAATPVLQKECSTSATSSSKRKATTLDTFIIKSTSYEKANLDEEVAKMIFETNSSFRLVEHPQFREMVGKLMPVCGCTPPTRIEIADKFLPMVYEKEYAKCATEKKDEIVCLYLD